MADVSLSQKIARKLCELDGGNPNEEWPAFLPKARAVLAAIRTPTLSMAMAAKEQYDTSEWYGALGGSQGCLELAYTAMIDAALAES